MLGRLGRELLRGLNDGNDEPERLDRWEPMLGRLGRELVRGLIDGIDGTDRVDRPIDREAPLDERDERPIDESGLDDREDPPSDLDGPPRERDELPTERDELPSDLDGDPNDLDGEPIDRDGEPIDREERPLLRDNPPLLRDAPPMLRDNPPLLRDELLPRSCAAPSSTASAPMTNRTQRAAMKRFMDSTSSVDRFARNVCRRGTPAVGSLASYDAALLQRHWRPLNQHPQRASFTNHLANGGSEVSMGGNRSSILSQLLMHWQYADSESSINAAFWRFRSVNTT